MTEEEKSFILEWMSEAELSEMTPQQINLFLEQARAIGELEQGDDAQEDEQTFIEVPFVETQILPEASVAIFPGLVTLQVLVCDPMVSSQYVAKGCGPY
jgi:hypothetical protein